MRVNDQVARPLLPFFIWRAESRGSFPNPDMWCPRCSGVASEAEGPAQNERRLRGRREAGGPWSPCLCWTAASAGRLPLLDGRDTDSGGRSA